jgi:hypothetical protein
MRKMIKYLEEFVDASFTMILTPKKSVWSMVIFCGAKAGVVALFNAD